MTKYKVSNIGLLLSLILVVMAYLKYDYKALVLLVPLFAFYILLLVSGSSSIRFNFYLKSLKRAHTNKKIISLTFDDGPDAVVTQQILQILKNYNIPAAFFCVGEKIEKNPDLLREVYGDGHIVGNHSYSHSKIFDLRSTKNMVKEIEITNKIIEQTIGKKPTLFRPPFGVTNPLLAKAIKRTGVISMGWSLRSWDTNGKIDSVVERLRRKVHPGDIILFHDNRTNTVEILNRLLPYLFDNGYQVIALDKLLKINPYAED